MISIIVRDLTEGGRDAHTVTVPRSRQVKEMAGWRKRKGSLSTAVSLRSIVLPLRARGKVPSEQYQVSLGPHLKEVGLQLGRDHCHQGRVLSEVENTYY